MQDHQTDAGSLNRRRLMIGAAAMGVGAMAEEARAAQARATAPYADLAHVAKDVRITKVEAFDIVVPQKPGSVPPVTRDAVQPQPGRINVTRVETNAGVRGYSFTVSSLANAQAANAFLAGKSLFAIETYLTQGLLDWAAVEEAMWDAIGKLGGQSVSRLLGGKAETVPVYVTCVWQNQNGLAPRIQGEHAAVLRQHGFRAMKIQIMRPDYRVDVEACREILAQGGPGFRVMVDRTAGAAGLWTYAQAEAAARDLQAAGCYWLEEPLARDDYVGPARLAKEFDILITGGEAYRGLGAYRQCLMNATYDVLQPEVRVVSGIMMTRKVGALCDAWGIPIAPHGWSGLAWAARVQVDGAMGALYQEIAVLRPPTLPDDLCAPYLPILHGEQPFKFRDGEVIVPTYPGLGLNLDEAAINRFRVGDIQPSGAVPGGGAAPVTWPPRA